MSFALSGPTSGTYQAGNTVNIQWTPANVAAGSKISLCYDSDTDFNGNEHWIEIDAVAAANGSGSYAWNTSGVAPGTYYIAGYMWDGGKPTFSHLKQAITIQGPAPAELRPERPHLGHLSGRQTVNIQWTAANVAAGSKISLCYDSDADFNGNEHWIEIDAVAPPTARQLRLEHQRHGGRHVLHRRLHVGRRQAHLLAPDAGHHHSGPPRPRRFALTGPTSGTYQAGKTVNIQWTAANVAAGSKISLCYDSDATSTATSTGSRSTPWRPPTAAAAYAWNTTGVAPGTYYIAGYMWDGSKPTFSHLKQPDHHRQPTGPGGAVKGRPRPCCRRAPSWTARRT